MANEEIAKADYPAIRQVKIPRVVETTPQADVKGGTLNEFAIAGKDGTWHWAEAVIVGDTVVVSSPEVAKPTAVRYAYRMNPATANLYNRQGLPASPFRSDE